MLVYDITNKESFKNLEYWLKELKDHADPNIVIALVANKVDVLFTDPGKREVLKEEAVIFAKKHGLIFTEESSALADVNIKNIIETLIISITVFLCSRTIEIHEVQTELVKLGKRDPKTLKLTYEEERHRELNGCC